MIAWRSRWTAYGSSPSARSSGAIRACAASRTWTGSTCASSGWLAACWVAARTGPRPEHQQVGQRVPAEAVRAVHPARDLASREQAGHRGRARLGVDPDAAHHVVRGRPDLHRPRRDVDVGQLLELLVHRGELAADVLGRQVADVEEDAAMRRSAALLDLGVDRPGDVVAGRQLRRPAGVGLVGPGTARVTQRLASSSVAAYSSRRSSGRYFHMKRSPSALRRIPPSPRTASVTSRPAHARRPDHPRRVELDELHVDEVGTGLVRECLAVAAVLPRVRRDLVGLADAAGRQHDRLGREQDRLRRSSASSRTRR